MIDEAVSRRKHQGCAAPGRCGWPRIIRVVESLDVALMPLCGFHRECIELAQRNHVTCPSDAVRLHAARARP